MTTPTDGPTAENATQLLIHTERLAHRLVLFTIAAIALITFGAITMRAHFPGALWVLALGGMGSLATAHLMGRAAKLAPSAGLEACGLITAICLALLYPLVLIVAIYSIAHVRYGGVYVIPQALEWYGEYSGTKRWALVIALCLMTVWAGIQMLMASLGEPGEDTETEEETE